MQKDENRRENKNMTQARILMLGVAALIALPVSGYGSSSELLKAEAGSFEPSVPQALEAMTSAIQKAELGIRCPGQPGSRCGFSETLPRRYESFILYSRPGHRPNPMCDVGTSMVVDYAEKTATLENFVKGICEIVVFPDKRVYQLNLPGVGNASGVYVRGQLWTEIGVETIEIFDSRNALVPGVLEALVRVIETKADGSQRTLYSPAHLKIRSLTTEKIVGMHVTGERIAISIGWGAGFKALGGVIGLEIDGQAFTVQTRRGEDAVAKVRELKRLIESNNFTVEQRPLQGIDTLELLWTLSPLPVRPF